jgi:hypothetical protein
MEGLSSLYNKIKEFSTNHGMVNEFVFARNEQELRNRQFEYRTIVLMPVESNISRDLNSPIYTIDFSLVVLDRAIYDNDDNAVSVIEENIFVIGQLQDFLIKEDYSVEFEDIDIMTINDDNYSVSSAIGNFSVQLSRKPYVMDTNN